MLSPGYRIMSHGRLLSCEIFKMADDLDLGKHVPEWSEKAKKTLVASSLAHDVNRIRVRQILPQPH